MLQSLRARLLVTHLLVGGLVFIILSLSFLFLLANNVAVERFVYGQLDTIARVGLTQARPQLDRGQGAQLNRLLGIMGRSIGARALVIDDSGEAVFFSAEDLPLPEEGAIRSALESDAGQGSYRDSLGRKWLMVVRPLRGERLLVVVAPRPNIRTLALLLQEGLTPLLQAALVTLAASLLLALLMARWVSSPLRKLSAASGKVAAGEFGQRIEPSGPKEVRELAVAFNEMVQKVQDGQAALRDFVANVSHELKTPLTSVQGFAQAIADGTAQGKQLEEAAAVIFDEAVRMRRLVDDLLDLARFDAGEALLARDPVDLGSLLQAVSERLQLAAESRGVELRVRVPELPRIIGDGDRLAQVFTNLVDNGIKHSPEEGEVTLRGRSGLGWVSVEIIDKGPGIEPQSLDRIFERFYQGDPSRHKDESQGTGLGLAISQEIVRAHGGRIEASSEVGKGSIFRVLLPVARACDETLARRQR